MKIAVTRVFQGSLHFEPEDDSRSLQRQALRLASQVRAWIAEISEIRSIRNLSLVEASDIRKVDMSDGWCMDATLSPSCNHALLIRRHPQSCEPAWIAQFHDDGIEQSFSVAQGQKVEEVILNRQTSSVLYFQGRSPIRPAA